VSEDDDRRAMAVAMTLDEDLREFIDRTKNPRFVFYHVPSIWLPIVDAESIPVPRPIERYVY
jgi:hypothetical protein